MMVPPLCKCVCVHVFMLMCLFPVSWLYQGNSCFYINLSINIDFVFSWYDLGVLLLDDPGEDIILQTYTQVSFI